MLFDTIYVVCRYDIVPPLSASYGRHIIGGREDDAGLFTVVMVISRVIFVYDVINTHISFCVISYSVLRHAAAPAYAIINTVV